MKKLFAIMAVLLLASCAGMGPKDIEMTAADQKLTALTDYTTAESQIPQSTDILYYVFDPAGSGTGPTSYSITVQALMSWLSTATQQIGTIELGAETDTTIARSAAGVVTVEGRYVPTSAQAKRIYVSDDCSAETGMATGDLCFEY